MLAYCGLDCETCPIHLAMLESDVLKKREMRTMISGELTRIYGIKMDPERVVDCDGCKAHNGRLFTGCSDCKIRKCAGEKGFDTCARCKDYPCDILNRHYAYDPASKARLDKLISSTP